MIVHENFVPMQMPKHITHLAFAQRMTKAERTAIRTSTNEDVQDIMFLFNSAKYIDLDRADTIAGVNALEALGILGAGRADEILSAEIKPEERP